MLKFWKKKPAGGSSGGTGKINGPGSSPQHEGDTALTPVEQLREAIESNNVAHAKKVLSAYPATANAPIDDLGQTCIHLAAVMGNVECMELLLKHGDVNVADSTGRTALHASVDHPELLRLLLKKKTLDVNRLGFNRQSLLHVMARKVVPIDEEMWSLLRKRLTNFNSTNVAGDTPLHIVALTGHYVLCEYLLSVPDVNVNVQNRKGETALFVACEKDHPLIASALLAYGASPFIADSSGRSPSDVCESDEISMVLTDAIRRLKTSVAQSYGNHGLAGSEALCRSTPSMAKQHSTGQIPSHHRGAYGSTTNGAAPIFMSAPRTSPKAMRTSPTMSTQQQARYSNRDSGHDSPHSPSPPSATLCNLPSSVPRDFSPLAHHMLHSPSPTPFSTNHTSSSSTSFGGSRDRSGSNSSFTQASHRLILMDEELSSSTPDSVDDSPTLSEAVQIGHSERLGVELVEELGHLLDDDFVLDALAKITSSKSFRWHRSFSRTKIEALKWLAEFIGADEDGGDSIQQSYLRHLKTKYPEAIKLTFKRIPSSKKLSKKQKSLKKLLLVERKLKSYEWEIEPEQLQFGEPIGVGSFGSVYSAIFLPTHEQVAVKQLASDVSDEDSATFIKEIAILSRLDHPAVVGFVGACISGTLSLVMEYCTSGNLKMFLRSHQTSWALKCRMARQSAEGISYLHSQFPPIVHRDLKCQNLLVTADGNVKVSDFGLSKTISRTIGNASRMGTLNWLAPEVLRGEVFQSTAVDVYAFGMVLYEILMDGTPPYDTWQPLQIVRAIDEGQRPEIPDSCDPRYRALMESCLAPLPQDRPTFVHICKELLDIERLANISASASSSPAGSAGNSLQPSPLLARFNQQSPASPRRPSPRTGSLVINSSPPPSPLSASKSKKLRASSPTQAPPLSSSATFTPGSSPGQHSPTLISISPASSNPLNLSSRSPELRSSSLTMPRPKDLNLD